MVFLKIYEIEVLPMLRSRVCFFLAALSIVIFPLGYLSAQSSVEDLSRNINADGISTTTGSGAQSSSTPSGGGAAGTSVSARQNGGAAADSGISTKKVLDTARLYVNNRNFHTPASWRITRQGNVACAYFVSYVLKKAGVISETEYYAPTLVKKLLATGKFEKVRVPPFKSGDIITWWGEGHIGFVTEDGRSIDNSSSAGCPKMRTIDTLGPADRYALRPKF